MLDDASLLSRYVENRSETAFAELVQRHLSLVYRSAYRQTGNVHLAEDVSQAVFSDLARKASSLVDRRSLAGWLHTSTRFASKFALRTEARRQKRDFKAAKMQETAGEPDKHAEWMSLRPVLDEALCTLKDRDREALLLRCIEGRSFAEIGAHLATSEDAARMRVDRALDKLRNLLRKRGLVSSSTALSAVLTEGATAAVPAGLAAKVASLSVTLPAVTGGIVSFGLQAFMTSKTTFVAIAVLTTGAAIYQFQAARDARATQETSLHEQNALRAKITELQKSLLESQRLLEAAEKDGALLFSTIDRTAATLATGEPNVRITHDLVKSRWQRAQALAKSGENEAALKEFLWCFDEGMRRVSGYGGVRSSYLLSELVDLGKVYPPALNALRIRRDQAEKQFRASERDFDALGDFAAVNRALRESFRTVQIYDRMSTSDPRRV